MASFQPFTKEQLNYFKFTSVVQDEFPKALRQTFVYMWNKKFGHKTGFRLWDDSIDVRKMFCYKEGGKTKVRNSYQEWDCTALFQATIFAKSFAIKNTDTGEDWNLSDTYIWPLWLAETAFHRSETIRDTKNITKRFTLAVDQLRRLRNMCAHPSQPKKSHMKKNDFDFYMRLTKHAFVALGVDAACVDAVRGLSEVDFPIARRQQLNEGIAKENERTKEVEGLAAEEVKKNFKELTAEKKEQEALFRKDTSAESSGLQSLQSALDIRLKLFGKENPDTAESYHDLGITQWKLEDNHSALQSFKSALDIRLILFAEEHADTAESYHFLGKTQAMLEDYHSALRSFKSALDIRRKLFGEEHADTAESYHFLGITQGNLKDNSLSLQSS